MLASLFVRFGYALIFVAAAIEGDATLVSGAFLARRGYFDLRVVGVVACLGTIAGNQIFYSMGRRAGSSSRVPAANLLDIAGRWISGRGAWVILLSRFLYGLRIAIPVACGATGQTWLRFTLIDCAGATLWTVAIATLGANVGRVLEPLIEDLRRHEWTIVAIILALGVIALLWRRPYRRARALVKDVPGQP